MVTVRFGIVHKKLDGKSQLNDFAPVQIRFSNGEGKQVRFNIPMSVYARDWDNRNQCVVASKKSVTDMAEAAETNRSLVDLKMSVHRAANGLAAHKMDREWLEHLTNAHFNVGTIVPKGDVRDPKRYVTAYMDDWIENRMPTAKARRKNKRLSTASKNQHRSFVNKMHMFEEETDNDLEFARLDDAMQEELVLYFKEVFGWQNNTMSQNIVKFKKYIKLAKRDGIEVHKNFPSDNFSAGQAEEKNHVVFTPEEINHIYNFDLSHDPFMDAERDWFVIAMSSGMAFADFYMTLDYDRHVMDDGSIQKRRYKNDSEFVIPPFYLIGEIFKKHGGLPPRDNEGDHGNANTRFNKRLKKLCETMGFTQMTPHPVVYWDPELKREAYGRCPKWMGVTSHCGRRTFATNMSRKDENGKQRLDDATIMDICGWKNIAMLRRYSQMTTAERVRGAETKVNEEQRRLAMGSDLPSTVTPLGQARKKHRMERNHDVKVIRLGDYEPNDDRQ